MRRHNIFAAAVFFFVIVLSPNPARASVTVDFGASPHWFSTTDRALGQLWLQGVTNQNVPGDPAFVPFGNVATTSLNANRMMWACGPGGTLCPFDPDREGPNGPDEAFFNFTFFIKPGDVPASSGGSIIADDYFEFYVNGHFLLAGALENHLGAPNDDGIAQPVPIALPDFTQFLHQGMNTLGLFAANGVLGSFPLCPASAEITSKEDNRTPFCEADNGFEYAFVQGSVTVLPEPDDLAVFCAVLIGVLPWWRRRKS